MTAKTNASSVKCFTRNGDSRRGGGESEVFATEALVGDGNVVAPITFGSGERVTLKKNIIGIKYIQVFGNNGGAKEEDSQIG
ncbi:hypothetical protein QYF36_000577 [Acer negundo]|nr:hypothetical protein QYF36_000577 [Acer negundo]